jgi:hypothetical protein
VSILLVSGFPTDQTLCFTLLAEACVLPQSSSGRQSAAIACGWCVEAALVSHATGHVLVAATLATAGSAVFSGLFATSKLDDPRSAHELSLRVFLTLALLLATTFTLVPNLLRVHFFYGLDGPARAQSVPAGTPGAKRRQLASQTAPDSAIDVRHAYSGIVLWPKKPSVTKLIAPSPLLWDKKRSSGQSHPVVIPFDGVYWFFRAPDTQPPAKSRESQGTPEMFDIQSTDWRRPLMMQAHQNFVNTIQSRCCSRIEVALRNRDRYPHSISIELVLIDNNSPGKPSESLGRESVNSISPRKMDDDGAPAAETLKFALPLGTGLKQFDEILMVFRLDGYRARTAAKIGIDHFTLVPRGM